MGNTLEFYTLNTGERRSSSPQGIQAETLSLLRPLLRHSGRLPWPFHRFELEVNQTRGGALFTLRTGLRPVCLSGLAWTSAGADEIWRNLEDVYFDVSDRCCVSMAAQHVPSQPGRLPWLGTVLLAGFRSSEVGQAGWISAFYICLGWTLLLEQNLRVSEVRQ